MHRPAKKIVIKVVRAVRKITSYKRGRNIKVVCAVSAAGVFVPPLFIFPRKSSPKGWNVSTIFIHWLKHFAPVIKCFKKNPYLSLLDGYHSHKTLEVANFPYENGITTIKLPPQSDHKLQPLDLTFFKSLKRNYNNEAGN